MLEVLTCLECLRTYVLDVLACLCVSYLAYLHVWGAFMVAHLHVCILSTLASFMSLLSHVSWMLTALKYLTCLHACVFGILVCFIYFALEKLKSKNSYSEGCNGKKV